MIIELAIGAGLVAASVVTVRHLRRRTVPPSSLPGGDADARGAVTEQERTTLRLGDVLLYVDRELWLAGRVTLDEEGFVLALFRAPGAASAKGSSTEWVAQLDANGQDVALLRETDDVPDGRVPEELPLGGMRLALRRRGRATVHSEGEHLPPVTEQADYAVLGGAGGRTLVVVDFRGGDRLALYGERITRDLLELLPGS